MVGPAGFVMGTVVVKTNEVVDTIGFVVKTIVEAIEIVVSFVVVLVVGLVAVGFVVL